MALHIPAVIDSLVYFPGTISLKPFHRLTAEDFLRDFQINCLGAVNAIQAALPSLRAAPSASIVLCSTIAVAQGMPFHASIAAAKGAVEGRRSTCPCGPPRATRSTLRRSRRSARGSWPINRS